jgi:hypothetical protein
VTAQVEGSVTNDRMQEITGEHSKDITAVLQTPERDGPADAAKPAALGELPRGRGLPPIRGRLPSKLPSFGHGTPVIGRTGPSQGAAASGGNVGLGFALVRFPLDDRQGLGRVVEP